MLSCIELLINRKSRRKDKESSSSPTPSPAGAPPCLHDDQKPYLDDDFTQERILDIDLRPLVLLPPGVDLNEWLATHSMYSTCINALHARVGFDSQRQTRTTCKHAPLAIYERADTGSMPLEMDGVDVVSGCL